MHEHLHACKCVVYAMHVCLHVCMLASVCSSRMYACMHACVHVCINACMCVCDVCIFVSLHVGDVEFRRLDGWELWGRGGKQGVEMNAAWGVYGRNCFW